MRKKILLLYEPVSQKRLIDAIIYHTEDSDNSIVGFNVIDWTFNDSNHQIPKCYRVFRFLRKYPIVSKIAQRLLITSLLKRISCEYDVIDMTYYVNVFYKFTDYLIRINKPYKITLWGSDFYRASENDLLKKKKYLEFAKIIQIETEQIKQDFLKVYPDIEKNIRICNYGVDLFQYIEEQRLHRGDYLKIDSDDKITVTCGYNLGRVQQHLIIIDALNKLQQTLKNSIHVIIPMTYGLVEEDYKAEIETALKQSGISYSFLTKKLNEKELADMRLLSNVVINIQISDALASSLVEHLFAESILIAGDWLPYSIFDEYGIYYEKASIENLSECVEQVLLNFNEKKLLAKKNIQNVNKLASWEYKTPILRGIFSEL